MVGFSKRNLDRQWWRLMVNYKLLVTVIFSLSITAFAEDAVYSGLHNDVPIGVVEGTELSINIAFPEINRSQSLPVVLFIHGGGFISGDKDSKNRQLRKFAEKGFVAASAMYRLSPEYRFPSQVEDIKLAIRFLKANANRFSINPDRIIVVGASAGSYLAVMAGVTGNSDAFSNHGLYIDQTSSVRAVVAQSSPIGNFTLPKYRESLTVQRLVNASAQDFSKTLQQMSPVTYLDPSDPPFFLSHGTEDELVPVDMSREFVKALEAINHDFDYYEVEGGTHSLSRSAPQASKFVFKELVNFIEKWSETM